MAISEGDKVFPIVLDADRNQDMIDFIDELQEKKKQSRTRILREILYYGKQHIEQLMKSGKYENVMQDKV